MNEIETNILRYPIKEDWPVTTEAVGDEWIGKDDFYNAYVGYCRAQTLPWEAKTVVGRELSEHVSVRSSWKRTEQGSMRAWVGIKLIPLSNTLSSLST